MWIVDAANVIGSRPDGWWRDRPSAARQLHDAILASTERGVLDPPILLVLEGHARAGVAATGSGPGADTTIQEPIRVVHAPRSGDEAILDLLAEWIDRTTTELMLVTADRALARSARALGAQICGPRTFRDRLDQATR